MEYGIIQKDKLFEGISRYYYCLCVSQYEGDDRNGKNTFQTVTQNKRGNDRSLALFVSMACVW